MAKKIGSKKTSKKGSKTSSTYSSVYNTTPTNSTNDNIVRYTLAQESVLSGLTSRLEISQVPNNDLTNYSSTSIHKKRSSKKASKKGSKRGSKSMK